MRSQAIPHTNPENSISREYAERDEERYEDRMVRKNRRLWWAREGINERLIERHMRRNSG